MAGMRTTIVPIGQVASQLNCVRVLPPAAKFMS
jgi:hypothetical protein